ncbi:hypothetical protein [Klebsiella pneumoniae]|uniref:hypothetical protein n=1 Tax=Klebsiella pneumoniae TaxID=573 RepID=UPI0015861ECF|nr:hypothetical protein [Klebsiella pneumoniae]
MLLQDIYKDENTGDFLIMLWKSDTDSTGSLLGASEDGEIGSSSVVKYTNSYRGKKLSGVDHAFIGLSLSLKHSVD